ncbi:MAG: bifunctional folylpolyglutamate synthase/dihydrofolate synthase [Lachnospiraceae bacterium]|nr:bifunctional folylpolyglutamate synthase/dihydrofolate synthase [Lachnospiraceae bacterium]
MTYPEALDYINAVRFSAWNLGLSRITVLMERLGNPQKQLKFVHVGGSNGKGSTCAMTERMLREAGYKTGLFPSPFIEDFRERIQVCGGMIPEDALCRITERVRAVADDMEDHPTHFELVTAIGLIYFAEVSCDIVVLEVGLGGEFDATNVIDPPEVAAFVHLGLEHTEYLGNTLTEIAKTKSGIIKQGSDVVSYENDTEVMRVFDEVCKEKQVPLHIARFSRLELTEATLSGQCFVLRVPAEEDSEDRIPSDCRVKDGTEFTLPLAGEYQLHNCVTALSIIEVLRKRGFDIPEDAVIRGIAEVSWPARFEVLSKEPLFILDGGHNPQCAEALAASVAQLVPGAETEGVTFLTGVLRDKDVPGIFDHLIPLAKEFFCLTPDSKRALPAEELAEYLSSRGCKATACKKAEDGIRQSLAKGLPVVAFGSLYLAGVIRRTLRRVLPEETKDA